MFFPDIHELLRKLEWSWGHDEVVYSWIEDYGTTLAFPAHGFVVGVIIKPWVDDCSGEVQVMNKSYSIFVVLWSKRNLNCFTVPTGPAFPFTSWRPWSNQSSYHCLFFFSLLRLSFIYIVHSVLWYTYIISNDKKKK